MESKVLAPVAQYSVEKDAPSLLYNNLHTVDKDSCLAYVSSGNAVLFCQKSAALQNVSSATGRQTDVASASLQSLTGNFAALAPILAATNPDYTELLIAGKAAAIAQHTEQGAGSGTCSAVAPVSGTSTLVLACGTSKGAVMFFDFNAGVSGSSLTNPSSPVNAHEGKSITAIDIHHCAGNHGKLGAFAASADIRARTVLWNYDRQAYLVLPPSGEDCATAVRITSECNLLVTVAYGSGRIIVYSALTGVAETTVYAHSHWINALTYTPARGGMLATAGEDSIVSVWYLPAALALTEADMRQNAKGVVELQHAGSAEIENALPTGVAFTADGSAVSVACYDDTVIRLFGTS